MNPTGLLDEVPSDKIIDQGLMKAWDVFISFKVGDIMMRIIDGLVKPLLERGIKVNKIANDSGADLKAIQASIESCRLVVLIATADYGEPNEHDVTFNSDKQLDFILDIDKPIFLVKSCSIFNHHKTRFRLPDTMPCCFWTPESDFPPFIVDEIERRVKSITPLHSNPLNRFEYLLYHPANVPIYSETSNDHYWTCCNSRSSNHKWYGCHKRKLLPIEKKFILEGLNPHHVGFIDENNLWTCCQQEVHSSGCRYRYTGHSQTNSVIPFGGSDNSCNPPFASMYASIECEQNSL